MFSIFFWLCHQPPICQFFLSKSWCIHPSMDQKMQTLHLTMARVFNQLSRSSLSSYWTVLERGRGSLMSLTYITVPSLLLQLQVSDCFKRVSCSVAVATACTSCPRVSLCSKIGQIGWLIIKLWLLKVFQIWAQVHSHCPTVLMKAQIFRYFFLSVYPTPHPPLWHGSNLMNSKLESS